MHKTTLLAILQQSEYDLPRLRKWAKQHQHESDLIQPADWTPKLKLINNLSSVFFFLPPLSAIAVATRLTQPLEQVIRWFHYFSASWKLWQAKRRGLIVVAIAGSFAKTSTKHILFHALSGSQKVLMTPKSINTLLGVAQVIKEELRPDHTVMIVELGEYHRHDIAKLCRFVQPDFGILTPIGQQHLEIMGSFATIVTELSDLLAYFGFNPDKTLVADVNRPHFTQPLTYYGTDAQAAYRLTSSQVTRAGTEANLNLPPHPDQPTDLEVFTPLYGEHQVVNALTSFWLADKLGINRTEIKKRLTSVPYIYRRHEPTFGQNDVLILDNSFNTNQDSVKASLQLLNQLNPSRRLMVTLGFTELGDTAETVHRQLGEQLASQVDYLGLIEAPWTAAITEGFVAGGGDKKHVFIGKNQEAAFQQLQQYIIPGSVILFEGGYQEVYI